MLKVAVLLFFLFTTVIASADDTYVFEAKGKFAKELKALVEKYSKDGKAQVSVYKKSNIKKIKSQETTSSILSIFSKSDADNLKYADVQLGKNIYKNKCSRCHGINASDSKYSTARNLSTLKPTTIVNLLKNYRDADNFGGNTKFIMKPQADSLVTKEMQSIAVYIYSLNHSDKLPRKQDSQSDRKMKEKSSYLQ